MDNKKTISYLNGKAWYRFLKVIFIFIFIAVILIANGINISEGIGRIDKDKTLIYCNGGDKRVVTARQAGVHFSNYEFIKGFNYKKFYEDHYNEYDIRYILMACYDEVPEYNNNEDIYLMQRVYEITGFKANPKKYDDNYLKEQFKIMTEGYKSKDQKISYLDYSIHLFDIKPVYNYKDFVLYSLIANFSILLTFEVLRRVFYYIALGTIKPKK
ncbi:MAG TPA: hypothetical protein PKN54_04860 [Candidatus Cloacimonas acidaminovorans]|nr:hypothetical protein [Candidatus Cloacimonas acidaminovorans]